MKEILIGLSLLALGIPFAGWAWTPPQEGMHFDDVFAKSPTTYTYVERMYDYDNKVECYVYSGKSISCVKL